jgi:hypothetical protein
VDKTIILQAPAITGVFIYLNIPKSLKNSLQYLAPSSPSVANFEPLYLPTSLSEHIKLEVFSLKMTLLLS